MKHRIAPGKEFRISRKRERYTMAIVEFLGYLHNLNTMMGGVMAHGGRPGTMEEGRREAMEVKIFGESMVEEVSNVGE